MKALSTSGLFALLMALQGVGASGQSGSLDIIPAVGQRVHLRIVHTTQMVDGNNVSADDVRIFRTGNLDAAVDRNNASLHVTVLSSDGSLQSNDALNNPDLANFLAILNVAHSITGVSGAGDSNGWNALVPIDEPRTAQPSASPAPALMVTIHSIKSNTAIAFSGETQTTLTPSAANQGSNGSNQGGHHGGPFGGGGYGGYGGFGHGGNGGQGEMHSASPITTLTLKISGTAVHGAVTKLAITEIRSIEVDSRQYLNTENWTLSTLQ
jgi:hypothetical protein